MIIRDRKTGKDYTIPNCTDKAIDHMRNAIGRDYNIKYDIDQDCMVADIETINYWVDYSYYVRKAYGVVDDIKDILHDNSGGGYYICILNSTIEEELKKDYSCHASQIIAACFIFCSKLPDSSCKKKIASILKSRILYVSKSSDNQKGTLK